MAENVKRISVRTIQGGNWADQDTDIFLRSFVRDPLGYVQRLPLQVRDMKNMDFDPNGFRGRKGSTAKDTINTNFLDSETFIDGIEFQQTFSTSRHVIVVGSHRLYTDQASAGTFVTAYASTTVDASSASGQKVLNVTATTGFHVGDTITIDDANGTGRESRIIDTIQDGVSLTVTVNLGSTFTNEVVDRVHGTTAAPVAKCFFVPFEGRMAVCTDGATAYIEIYRTGATVDDPMNNGNTFHVDGSSGDQTYTGTWSTAAYSGAYFNGRFCFSTGDQAVEYTDAGQPWDLLGGSFKHTRGGCDGLLVFSPELQDELSSSLLYIWTGAGLEVMNGFSISDQIDLIDDAGVLMNNKCFAAGPRWVYYLTKRKRLLAIAGSLIIDVGRRFIKEDGTGPLNDINSTDGVTNAVVRYNPVAKQVMASTPISGTATNDTTFVLDIKQGEAVPGEQPAQFEQRIRCLLWFGLPFVAFYLEIPDVWVGVKSDGTSWTMSSGDSDEGSIAIDQWFKMPAIKGTGEASIITSHWLTADTRFYPTGNWLVDVEWYIDRDASTTGTTLSLLQITSGAATYGAAVYGTSTYSSDSLVRARSDVYLQSEEIQWRVRNQHLTQTFILSLFELRFTEGAVIV